MRGCRSLWVGLFKKATKYDFIKGKVNLHGGFVLTPHAPRRPLSPLPFSGLSYCSGLQYFYSVCDERYSWPFLFSNRTNGFLHSRKNM